MIGRLKLARMALAALIVAPLATVQASSAQQEMGRVKVLVPDLFATDGEDRGWGEDVAKELREVINELATHQPIERNDIRDQLRRFELKMEDLNCISTIQLAPQISAGVAFCADFRVSGDNRELFDIAFVDATSSARFPVEDFTVHKDEKEEAAARIGAEFDILVQQLRFRLFCFDYAQQEDWTAALRNCDDALGLNANDQGVRYQRAQALRQLDRMDEALTEVQTILEADPYDEDALNLGGYLATTLGEADEGREYYGRYLEVNPNAEAVRRRIAYDLFDAGDPEGAMLLLEAGIENDDSPDLLGDLGSYAMEAARQATPGDLEPGADLPAEVVTLYRRSISALEQVFEVRGDSMDVGQIRNIVSAYAQIGEAENAVTFAERALAIYPEEAALLSTYSTALQRLDRIDEAVGALQRIEDIQPDYPDLFARQSQLLIQAGRRDDAIPIMQRAIQQGSDADRMAQLLFSDAYQKGLDTRNANRNLDYGISGVQAAKGLDGISAETRAQMDFWHGYGLYLKGVASQEPNTLASARASQPMFEQSLPLLSAGASYAPSVGINPDQIIQAAQQYLDIQNAIIRRGR